MSIEDPGQPERRPATPAWPPSLPDDVVSPASLATPVRVEGLDDVLITSTSDDDLVYDDEEFEQFDWDTWQPAAIPDDDGPKAEEVDWTFASSTATASATEWAHDVQDTDDWDLMAQASPDSILSQPWDVTPAPMPFERPLSLTRPKTPERRDADVDTANMPLPTSLAEPLRASGKPWPPTKQIIHDVVHVRVPRWAPFVTGLALALAMVLASAALVSQTGRLGLTLAVLTGQVPTSADAVVGAYLNAIERGDAAKARTFLKTPPADSLLLDDVVLRRSIERSPFTVLHVGSASSSLAGTQRVAASYSIGGQVVDTTMTTDFAEGQWWISDDPGRIGLGSLRAAGIPLFINGVEIPSTIDSLPAFPGTYELATTNPYITYSSPSTIVVRSSDEAPVHGAARLELTEAGKQLAFAATRTAITACLARHELQPAGCPQNFESNRTEPPVAETITYTVTSDVPMTVADSDLRAATVTVTYNASWRLDLKVKVNGTPQAVTFPFQLTSLWQVNLSDAKPTAVLVQ